MKQEKSEKQTIRGLLKAIDWRDKRTYLMLAVVGILLLVIALPGGGSSSQKSVFPADAESGQEESNGTDSDRMIRKLEQRLEKILSRIDGAGQVEVMITLADEGEQVVEKDTQIRTDENSETTVYTRDGSVETPFVNKVCTPRIGGVIVVAQGGGDSVVKQEILSCIQSLFDLEPHKITVVKMSLQEGEVS